MPPSPCIQPNLDISGIGVRTAIYAQAVFTLAQPLIAAWDGEIDDRELKSLHHSYLGILLPGCALIFSAIIQAKTFGLSVYHSLVVLNLSWINNLSALIFFSFVIITEWRSNHLRVEIYDRLELIKSNLNTALGGSNTRSRPVPEQNTKELSLKQMPSSHTASQWDSVSRGAIGEFQEQKNKLEREIVGFKWEVKRKIWRAAVEHLTDWIEPIQMRQSTEAKTDITSSYTRMAGHADAMSVETKNGSDERYDWRLKEISRPSPVKSLVLSKDVWFMAALASGHLILMSCFGLWLWFNVRHFDGEQASCVSLVHYSIFGVPVPVNSEALRIVSIVVYFLGTIPVVNIGICVVATGFPVVILGILLWIANERKKTIMRSSQACKNAPSSSRAKPPPKISVRNALRNNGPSPSVSEVILFAFDNRFMFYSAICITLIGQAYFIACTEVMIRANQPALIVGDQSESNWTFGQTLAIALLAIPLLDIAKSFWKLWKQTHHENQEKRIKREEENEEEETEEPKEQLV